VQVVARRARLPGFSMGKFIAPCRGRFRPARAARAAGRMMLAAITMMAGGELAST